MNATPDGQPNTEGDPNATLQHLHAQLAALRQSLAARDEFIAALGRELNNPLTPLTVAAERVRSVAALGDADRLEAALDMFERARIVFEQRTRALLTMVEMTQTAPQLSITEVDVAAILADAAARHGDQARRAGCSLQIAGASPLLARADAAALGHVLDQLLANALRFGAGMPVLLRAARRDDGRVTLSICDRGPGFATAEHEAAFGLLRRPRAAGAPGLGIGLWVSCQLAMAMGASMAITECPPWSACLDVTLPAHG